MKCGEKLHTLGKRAAISFTATCILSAQGIKLLEEKMIDTVLKSHHKNHQRLESEKIKLTTEQSVDKALKLDIYTDNIVWFTDFFFVF